MRQISIDRSLYVMNKPTVTTICRLMVVAMATILLGGCLSVELSLPGGPMPSYSLTAIRVANNSTVRLEAGVYEGRLDINANNATIIGAGIGRTVIRGPVTINGNTNEFRGLSIIGPVRINGNTNDLSRCDLSDAWISANGNNNRY
jgi:hypothetical protein